MSKSHNSRRKYAPYIIGSAISASFGMAASVVHAETKALEEVIVTAQKREQSVQEVPVAMTALTQEALATNRVANVTDLSGLAPNVVARPAPGGNAIASFSMRGITSYGVVPGSDKEVSIYLDGVYIGSPRGSIFNLPDIAQLEVLRGPQGTLFGRNATAGAINITTRDPAGEFGLRQELSAGNHDYRRTRTSIDSPTWGAFSFSGTYAHEERDGDIKNSAYNSQAVWDRTAFGEGTQHMVKRLGDKDADTYFLAAKFQPSDAFTMVYKFDKGTDTGTPTANAPIAYNPAVLGAILAFQPGGNPIHLASKGKRPSSVADSFATPLDQTNTGHSLTTTFEASDNVSIKNITAYRKSQLWATGDLVGMGGLVDTFGVFAQPPGSGTVGAPFCVVCLQSEADSDQWSTELQVNYESDLLTATTGFLYFESDDRSGAPVGSGNTSFFVDYPNYVIPSGNHATAYNRARSAALYTQLEYHLTDTVDLLGGLRWTRDNKSGDIATSVGAGADTHHPFTFAESRPSYMLGVNYKPTFDTLVYGKYSNAFVSGGSTGGIAFESEIAKSWEAGIKSDFMGSKLRSNLSVFDVTYSHVQSAQGGSNVGHPELGTVIIDQGGDTKAYGFEWEGSAAAGYGFTLNASLGYQHVYFPDGVSQILMNSVQAGFYPGSKYLPSLIPDWTGNLSAQYESDPLFGESYLALNLGGNWHSAIRMEQNPARAEAKPSFLEWSPASWVVNARASLKKIDLGFAGAQGEVALWGRNLTDNKEPNFALNFNGFANSASYMEARSYGVDFVVQF